MGRECEAFKGLQLACVLEETTPIRLLFELRGDFCNRLGNERLTDWADEYRRQGAT